MNIVSKINQSSNIRNINFIVACSNIKKSVKMVNYILNNFFRFLNNKHINKKIKSSITSQTFFVLTTKLLTCYKTSDFYDRAVTNNIPHDEQ